MYDYQAEKEAFMRLYFSNRISAKDLHEELERLDSYERGEKVMFLSMLITVAVALAIIARAIHLWF